MKSVENRIRALLIREIIKGIRKLYKGEPKICETLINIFTFFEGYVSDKLDAFIKLLKYTESFKLTVIDFIPKGKETVSNDGDIFIKPGKKQNEMQIYINEGSIRNKIETKQFSFKFKFYLILENRFPSVELKYQT